LIYDKNNLKNVPQIKYYIFDSKLNLKEEKFVRRTDSRKYSSKENVISFNILENGYIKIDQLTKTGEVTNLPPQYNLKIESSKNIEDAEKTTAKLDVSKKFIENNIISIRRMYVNGFIDKTITNTTSLLTKSAISENRSGVPQNVVIRNKISFNQSNNESGKIIGHPVQTQKDNTKNNSNPKTNEESSLPTLIDDYIFHYRKRKSTTDNGEIDQEDVSDFPKVVKQKSSLNDISPTYSSPQLDILMSDANTLPDYVDKGAVRYKPAPWPGWGGGGGGENSWNNWDDNSYSYSNSMPDSYYVDPCDPFDINSACYVQCPPNFDSSLDGLQVDALSFSKILDAMGISQFNPIVRLIATDDNGKLTYKLTGAYTDSNGNYTTFTPITIGQVPNYANWSTTLMSNPYSFPTGDPVFYNNENNPNPDGNGTIQNYTTLEGEVYAIFTSISGIMTCLPGVQITNEFITSGAGMTVNNVIHLDTTRNGLSDIMHEYGHFLQQEVFGSLFYNGSIVPASLLSATFSPNNHQKAWTETGANALSMLFFGPTAPIVGNSYYKSSACN
jgi:hypothetical protein